MKKTISALITSSLLGAALISGAAYAQETPYYKSEIEKAKIQYETDKKRCDTLKGNDRDVCQERAAANLQIAESDLKAYEKNTTAANIKAEKERIKQLHKVDDEKCESYKGNAKDVCEAQADAVMKRREGNLKALESRLEGDYKLAIEKCETLSGDKRSACKDEAKRTYKP
jgi:hypothetical protein